MELDVFLRILTMLYYFGTVISFSLIVSFGEVRSFLIALGRRNSDEDNPRPDISRPLAILLGACYVPGLTLNLIELFYLGQLTFYNYCSNICVVVVSVGILTMVLMRLNRDAYQYSDVLDNDLEL